MSMFDAYRLIPEDYIPDNIHIADQVYTKIKKPLVSYNRFGDPVGFTWNQGDTIYLEFVTTGEVVYEEGDSFYDKEKEEFVVVEQGFTEDPDTYFNHSPKTFHISLYNFRYNEVASVDIPAKAKTSIISTAFDSANLPKGVYKLQLNLVDSEAETQWPLIDRENCQIFIR